MTQRHALTSLLKPWIDEGTRLGEPLAWKLLGDHHLSSSPPPLHTRLARHAYTQASAAGCLDATEQLIPFLVYGLGGPSDIDTAAHLLDRASLYSAEAAMTAARFFLSGRHLLLNFPLARRYLHRAHRHGHPLALLHLHWLTLLNRPWPTTNTEALACLLRHPQVFSPLGLFTHALFRSYGVGCEKNPPQARSLFELALRHGIKDAAPYLAPLLLGDGEAPSSHELHAISTLLKSAATPRALFLLARLLEHTHTAPTATIMDLDHASAAQGLGEATFRTAWYVPRSLPRRHRDGQTLLLLARAQSQGFGLGPATFIDRILAEPTEYPLSHARWFRITHAAATLGHVPAMLHLANFYRSVPENVSDPERARFWLASAAHAESTEALTKLGVELLGDPRHPEHHTWLALIEEAAAQGDDTAPGILRIYWNHQQSKIGALPPRSINSPKSPLAHEGIQEPPDESD